ncbi:MAG TPA: nucleotide exchange factor GrpE [Terriglobales bacterium]|nr:nucleotide exchange factor GrpE [Terriglobales bacterium]
MARTNGKTELEEQRQMDAEHELPPSDGSEDQPSSTSEQAKVERVSEVEKLRAERDVLLDRLARMQAEFDNARKRAQREQQDYRDYALTDTVKTLIPVMDSFDRALQSSPEKSEFHLGVELIHKQLLDALTKIGVQPVKAKGQQFDPRFHEAIEMVDTADAQDNEVIDELQRGYKLKDRLLRPAMVRVAHNSKH